MSDFRNAENVQLMF